MPFYDYGCEDCGPFTAMRPMAEYQDPQPCPSCGGLAPRAILTAPRLAILDAGRRSAHATNERSANAPRSSSAGGHRAGCACCTTRSAGALQARAVDAPGGGGEKLPQ